MQVVQYNLCNASCAMQGTIFLGAVQVVQYKLCSTSCAVQVVQYKLCSTSCAVQIVQYVLLQNLLADGENYAFKTIAISWMKIIIIRNMVFSIQSIRLKENYKNVKM